MLNDLNLEKIDGMAAVYAVNATLRRIDERLMDHGERVAFIACELCEAGGLELDIKTLFLLCIFHDIGAYKTDEIDRMVEFETHDVLNHSIYGYLFLKYLTPLKDYAQAVLHHHTPWRELRDMETDCRDYAALIHLADRIDIASHYDPETLLLEKFFASSDELLRGDYVSIMAACCKDRALARHLADGSYIETNRERCSHFMPRTAETLEYLKMIVYAIDFRSEYTVTHTINTVSLSLNIAEHFALDEKAMEQIYLGSLLHDVGKISIPLSILENPGRLTAEEMDVMRTHVAETETLISGIVPEAVCKIAVRHHEKLDGSGYPHALKADELSFPERIVAVADIVSALSSRRSYKEPFPKEKTLSVLLSMEGDKLDTEICDYVAENYDDVIAATEADRASIIDTYQSIMREYSAQKTAISEKLSFR